MQAKSLARDVLLDRGANERVLSLVGQFLTLGLGQVAQAFPERLREQLGELAEGLGAALVVGRQALDAPPHSQAAHRAALEVMARQRTQGVLEPPTQGQRSTQEGARARRTVVDALVRIPTTWGQRWAGRAAYRALAQLVAAGLVELGASTVRAR